MSFKQRLTRFAADHPLHSPRNAASELGATAPCPESSDSTAAQRRLLQELRAKMEGILGAPRYGSITDEPRRDPPLTPRAADAGMLEWRTEQGMLWRQCERCGGAARVGRFELSSAAEARGHPLSLLALQPELSDVDFQDALYLDTETTGLGGGAGTYAFLLGLCYFKDGAWQLEQLMLSGPEQEAAMLEVLRQRLASASCLISFNGKSYDWPLIKGRYVLNHLPVPPSPLQLDLLHLCRRIHKERLVRCTLKAVEAEVLGFERLDDIEGAEVAGRYAHFLRTGDASTLSSIVEHNRWDVLSMVALVGLYGEEQPALIGADFVGLARTLKKARALERAVQAANTALRSGGGASALRVRGEIHKALGDRLAALSDYEDAERVSPDPALRLEIAKLYEHRLRAPARALAAARKGTAESEELQARRIARLERKLGRGSDGD